jgi:hypothetical protein
MNDPISRAASRKIMPEGHDIRKEARRRLMIGLTGLVVVMFVVVLAGLLTGQARQEAELAKAQAEAAGVNNPGSSSAALGDAQLSDMGVTAPAEGQAGTDVLSPAPPTGSAVVVPDLQPDPQLERLKNDR